MKPISTANHLILLLLTALLPMAASPGEPEPDGELHSTRVLVEEGEDEERDTRILEKQRTIRLKASPKSSRCEATLAVEYLQHDTIASFAGTIRNEDCAASGGDYVIAIRVRDRNGEVDTFEFSKLWQRSDDRPVTFRGEYPIGENVDLVSVRPRWLRCVCADTPGD